ncbi:MAG: leucyl aminopeptidase [Nitrospirae bacterium]|nr:MAG: leucyl aminopeptidase [Nitrospirota bacterium]
MKFSFTNRRPDRIKTDILLLPVFKGQTPEPYGGLPEIKTLIEKPIKDGFFKGEFLELLLLPSPSGISASFLLMLGMGEAQEVNAEKIRKAGGKTASHLRGKRISRLTVFSQPLMVISDAEAAFTEGFLLGNYTYSEFKKEKNPLKIRELQFTGRETKSKSNSLREVTLSAGATNYARDLINTPANHLDPLGLAEKARELASSRIKVQVIRKRALERLGMEAFLSVSRGSSKEPCLIILKYRGNPSFKKEYVLIGKSVTFDSGGLSLKPSEGMEKMKYDMSGGAAVLGVFQYLKKAGLPVNVTGILPATENLPGGTASKPGDIVRTITGKTVEILNTDAEGRLTLADAIGYSRRLKPLAIIDIATLTGACSIALGNEAIGLMGNNKDLLQGIKNASSVTGEKVWEMPLFDEYKEYIKGEFGDLKNTGGRSGAFVTAGYFLKEFAEDTPWAHLDIASTAWTDKEKPCYPVGATGVGTRLLISFLKGTKR